MWDGEHLHGSEYEGHEVQAVGLETWDELNIGEHASGYEDTRWDQLDGQWNRVVVHGVINNMSEGFNGYLKGKRQRALMRLHAREKIG